MRLSDDGVLGQPDTEFLRKGVCDAATVMLTAFAQINQAVG
jgi:hypothetical protein